MERMEHGGFSAGRNVKQEMFLFRHKDWALSRVDTELDIYFVKPKITDTLFL